MGRLDETRAAFDNIYNSDVWGLKTDEYASAKPGMESEHDRNKRFSALISDLIRLNEVKHLVEFGCGWWKYMIDVDLTGVQYDGYDIVDSVIQDNKNQIRRGEHPLSHSDRWHPHAESRHAAEQGRAAAFAHGRRAVYLSLFRTNFRFMLIGNDCKPTTS